MQPKQVGLIVSATSFVILSVLLVIAVLARQESDIVAAGPVLAVPRTAFAYESGFWLDGRLDGHTVKIRIDAFPTNTRVRPEVAAAIGLPPCIEPRKICRRTIKRLTIGPYQIVDASVIVTGHARNRVELGHDVWRHFEVAYRDDVVRLTPLDAAVISLTAAGT